MIDFINKFDNVFYKELKVKHLKVIYKTLLGDTPDPEIAFYNFNKIINYLTNLTDKKINNFNFIEYFLLLLEFRITSIGNIVFAQLQDGSTKIEFNLTKIKEQLIKINNKYSSQKIQLDDITVICDLPTINDLLYINQFQKVDSFYICFVKKIIIKDKVIDFKNLAFQEKNTVFETLPAKLSSKLIKIVIESIEFLNTINLISYLTSLKNVNLAFNLNVNNLISFLKFIFGDNLLSLYDNIFALCKLGNFTPEYIENCTPGEYLLLVKKLEQINAQSNKEPIQEQLNEQTFNDGLEDTDSFAYPDLPPITSQANYGNLGP
jgi:hypothetical protein